MRSRVISRLTRPGYESRPRLLRITRVPAAIVGMAMPHESSVSNGIARMRALEVPDITGGHSVAFGPGVKHLMLMDLNKTPRMGEFITISFTDSTNRTVAADLQVRRG